MLRFFLPTVLFLQILVSHTSAALAKTSSEIMHTDITTVYSVIRSEIESKELKNGAQTWVDEPGSSYVGITPCGNPRNFYIVKGPLQQTLTELAFISVTAQQSLKWNKYPSEIWRGPLADFEKKALTRVESGARSTGSFDPFISLAENLQNSINTKLKAYSPKYKPTNVHPECGGPVEKILVHIKPKDATASIIPKMFYIYCQKVGLNPDDKASCDNWFPPIRDGETILLGGIYKYRINREGQGSPVSEFDADRASNGSITLE